MMVFRSSVVILTVALCAAWASPVQAQSGACCVDGACQPNVTQGECVDDQCGTWLGKGTDCGLCPFVQTGVCCVNGSCNADLGFDSCECAGGTFISGPTACTGVTCDLALGRCCAPGGCSDGVSQDECLTECGTWSAGQTCAAGLPCPLAFGACCVGETCLGGTGGLASCNCLGGTWFNNESCGLGSNSDCNGNGVVDLCENGDDCNNNGLLDECDIQDGTSADCNGNGQPDECELDPDCSQNGGVDCNFDGVLDECEDDCQPNGTSDICELVNEQVIDCGGGGPDVGSPFFGQILHNANCAVCHGVGGNSGTAPNHRNMSRFRYQWKTSGCVSHVGGMFEFSLDQFADLEAYLSDLGGGGNGVPDECESLADCDNDGIADECELAACPDAQPGDPDFDPSCRDCNANGIPDGCDIADGTEPDCNTNGIPDACDLASGENQDCNSNGIPDVCDIAAGTSQDCNGDGIPNECDPDCNNNMNSDVCDVVVSGAEDCDGNLVPDECEPDCNNNGVNDTCDIQNGTSSDINNNGIPDDCDPDCNGNMIPDDLDLFPQSTGLVVGEDFGVNGLQIPDCDGSGDEFVRTVDAQFGPDCAPIQALHVLLDLDHTWIGDLVAEIESPNGTVVTLFSRIGYEETNPYCGDEDCCGISATSMAVDLGDAWPMSIESATDLTGNYAPDAGATANPGALAAFAGQNSCGQWTLRVHDGAEFDTGVVYGWSIDFRSTQVSQDCNANGQPDECDIAQGAGDCNNNGIPDDCEDCNGNGFADSCDIANGISADCNNDGVPDECGIFRDCNGNGTLDACDLDNGIDTDCNANGVLDSCDIAGNGGIFVSAFNSGNVTAYDALAGTYLGPFVAQTPSPAGITFGPDGDLLVANYLDERISRFAADTGASLGDFVPSGVLTPIDLELGPDGNIYAVSLGAAEITAYDGNDGTPLGTFASLPVSKTPELPLAMRFGPDGDLYVAVFNPARIVRFNGVTGAYVEDFGDTINLLSAVGLDFAPDGNLYVSDSVAGTIEIFDGVTGAAMGTFVTGFPPNELAFFPIEFGPDGDLYLTHSTLNVVASLDGATGVVEQVFPSPDLVFPISFTLRPPSLDCDGNSLPDECEDCNSNGIGDSCEIANGMTPDINGNGIPDECEGEDVTLALVIREDPYDSDTTNALPPSIQEIELGRTFFADVWATDGGALNTGLTQVHADLLFDANAMEVVSIEHRAPFDVVTSGNIDNTNGIIADLGGTAPDVGGIGVAPEWQRVAVVTLDAIACPSMENMTLQAADLPITAFSRDEIDPANIAFGGASTAVTFQCAYNLDGVDPINAGDLGIFAGCWLTGVGEPGYQRRCDFDCSGFVDAGDLGWFAAGWLNDCSSLSEDDMPPCRRCDSNGVAALPAEAPDISIGYLPVQDSSPQSKSATIDIFVRDDAETARGVTSLYLDLNLRPANANAWSITSPPQIEVIPGQQFQLFPATADRVDATGYDIGGATVHHHIGSGQWVHVARVSTEDLSSNRLMTALQPASSGVSAVGWGVVDPGTIQIVRLRKHPEQE
ncbi:MAG: hypothetical protein ACPGXK_01545 [Phycisphaerae bacterium]